MIRWKYVIPRAIILFVVLLAVYLGTNPMIRWTLITAGQAATGAKVDIGWVRSSLTDGRVEIEGIQLADPKRPDRNLVEADRAVLNMSMDGFLHRKFIIEEGRMDGIRFGTERMTSGALPEKSAEEKKRQQQAAEQAAKVLKPWLNDIRGRLEQLAYDQSETAQVADELLKRWPQEYEAVRAEAESIRLRVRAIKSRVEQASENPLRNVASFQQSYQEIPTVKADIDRLYQRLDQLAQQLPRDRQAILEAKARDQQKITQLTGIGKIDGESISEIALGEENGKRVFQIAEWLHWVRAAVPNPKDDFVPERTRGVDLMFGVDRQPDILIKRLALSGSGRLDGDRYEVTGSLTGITTQPKLYGEPSRLKLTAKGPKTILVTAELDRSSTEPMDRFRVICPEISNGRSSVGSGDTIQLAFDGGKTTLECNLILQGDQLVGVIRTTHREVELAVTKLDSQLGGNDVRTLLSNSLSEIQSFDVTLHLTGTLEKPKFRLESDLGPRVADRFQLALHQELDRRIENSLVALEDVANRKLAELQRTFESQHGVALADLRLGNDEIARLRTEVAERLSFGRIR